MLDMDKKSVKAVFIGIICVLVLWIGISIFVQSATPSFDGVWTINDDEFIIAFYDNDICICDGEEMYYHVIDNHTISLDGELFEFEIIDKKQKLMNLDEKD